MYPDNPSEQPTEPRPQPDAPAPEAQREPVQPVFTGRSRRGGGTLVATVAGVALFGVLIGFAADRWAVTNLGQNPLGAIAPTITTGPRTGPVAARQGKPTVGQTAPTAT